MPKRSLILSSDSEAEKSVERATILATRICEGNISDEELDKLCEAALSERVVAIRKEVLRGGSAPKASFIY